MGSDLAKVLLIKKFIECVTNMFFHFKKYFERQRRTKTATDAKERLQIIIAHERNQAYRHIHLPSLQRDLLNVVRKYVIIEYEHIKINLEKQGNYEILELNITLPDMEKQPLAFTNGMSNSTSSASFD